MPTPNYSLPTYGPSDTAALDTLLNGQSSAIDAALLTVEGRTTGATAVRTALAAPRLKEGLEFYETDTDRTWLYDGTQWLAADNGRYLIRPGSVTGANISVAANGEIVFTGASASGVHIENCFSNRFRHYEAVIEGTYTSNSSPQFQLRVSGSTTAPGGTDYKNSYNYNNGSSPAYVQNDIGIFATSGAGGTRVSSRVLFVNPFQAVATQYLADTVAFLGTGPTLVQSRIAAHHIQAVSYSSLTLTHASGQNFTGTMRIYGYA